MRFLDQLREDDRLYDPHMLFIPDWRWLSCDYESEGQYAASMQTEIKPQGIAVLKRVAEAPRSCQQGFVRWNRTDPWHPITLWG